MYMANKKQFKLLVQAVLKLKTEKEVFDFLSEILTPQELKQLPTRLEIIKMLEKGLPQREIAKKLGVGIATVTRGAKELQKK